MRIGADGTLDTTFAADQLRMTKTRDEFTSFWNGQKDGLRASLSDGDYAHVIAVMKEEAKSIMMGPMPRAEARRMLAATLPLETIERVGQVKHVGPCPFNGRTAYHVVLMVPQGKVTLLVMPGYRMEGPRRAGKEGLSASVGGMGDGSVGVIGSDAAVVDSVMGALKA